jgi:iron complex transport system substrate-binding protein
MSRIRNAGLALLSLTLITMTACSPKPAPATESPKPAAETTAPWTFTDDRGKTVSLPKRPLRIVAQSDAAAALWDLGIKVVGVFGPQHRPDGSKDPEIGNVDLNAVTSVGEKWGEIDLEKLAALRPDLIVSTMWQPPDLWYVQPEVAAKVEAIAPTIGINVAQKSITVPAQRFADLAGALGADLNAPAVAAAKQRFEKASAELKATIAAKPGLKVLAAAGSLETFWVANPPYYADLLYFKELGLDIVVPSTPQQFTESLSWEQALRYPADLILYDNRSHVVQRTELAEKVPTWSMLPAVKAGQVSPWHAVPSYSYQGFTPILEQLTEIVRKARTDVVQ